MSLLIYLLASGTLDGWWRSLADAVHWHGYPTFEEPRYVVLVARLHRDPHHAATRQLSRSLADLSDLRGVEVLEVPRRISLDGDDLRAAEKRGHLSALEVLGRTGADMIIWGERTSDETVSLFWTTRLNAGGGTPSSLPPRGTLPDLLLDSVHTALAPLIVTEFLAALRPGAFEATWLAPLVDKLEAFIASLPKDAPNMGDLQFVLATAQSAVGEQCVSQYHLLRAVSGFREIVGAWVTDDDADGWCTVQNNLSIALKALGTLQSDIGLLDESIEAARHGLGRAVAVGDPGLSARLHTNLAASLWQRGRLAHDIGDLDEARRSYIVAKKIINSANIQERARVSTAIAGVSVDLARATRSADGLAEAISQCAEALALQDAAVVPEDRAMTLNTMALAYRLQSDFTGDLRWYSSAEDAWQEGLVVCPRAGSPRVWAMLQYNLADLRWSIGEAAASPTILKAAADSIDAVLEVYTPSTAPAHWRRALRKKATVLGALARVAGDGGVALEAQTALDELARAKE